MALVWQSLAQFPVFPEIHFMPIRSMASVCPPPLARGGTLNPDSRRGPGSEDGTSGILPAI
jgi:hypothetical protein